MRRVDLNGVFPQTTVPYLFPQDQHCQPPFTVLATLHFASEIVCNRLIGEINASNESNLGTFSQSLAARKAYAFLQRPTTINFQLSYEQFLQVYLDPVLLKLRHLDLALHAPFSGLSISVQSPPWCCFMTLVIATGQTTRLSL